MKDPGSSFVGRVPHPAWLVNRRVGARGLQNRKLASGDWELATSPLDIRHPHPEASAVLPVHGNTVAVVPCLNEARTIGALVPRLLHLVREVLVIDDGSSDETGRLASLAGARVIRHDSPLGKGAALATGWTVALQESALWTLLLDGDGQHDPDDAPRLFAAAVQGIHLVVGNRMPNAQAMPFVRRHTNRWMSRRISTLAGREIPDSQCGYRLVHLPSLQKVGLRSRCFEIESEMIVAFARAGLGIASAPIQVRYRGERSKISPVRDTLRWFRWYRTARR